MIGMIPVDLRLNTVIIRIEMTQPHGQMPRKYRQKSKETSKHLGACVTARVAVDQGRNSPKTTRMKQL